MTPHIQIGGIVHALDILARRPHLRLRVGARDVTVEDRLEDGLLLLDGRPVPCTAVRDGGSVFIRLSGRTLRVEVLDPREEAEARAEGDDSIVAPMPGAVVSVHCSAGDRVAAGETMLTIESMKLQMSLAAPRDGVVAEVSVAPGSTFDKGHVLVAFAPVEGG